MSFQALAESRVRVSPTISARRRGVSFESFRIRSKILNTRSMSCTRSKRISSPASRKMSRVPFLILYFLRRDAGRVTRPLEVTVATFFIEDCKILRAHGLVVFGAGREQLRRRCGGRTDYARSIVASLDWPTDTRRTGARISREITSTYALSVFGKASYPFLARRVHSFSSSSGHPSYSSYPGR